MIKFSFHVNIKSLILIVLSKLRENNVTKNTMAHLYVTYETQMLRGPNEFLFVSVGFRRCISDRCISKFFLGLPFRGTQEFICSVDDTPDQSRC